jgi:hypothetical protein
MMSLALKSGRPAQIGSFLKEGKHFNVLGLQASILKTGYFVLLYDIQEHEPFDLFLPLPDAPT